MRNLPFSDSEFHSVLSVHSLEHVPNPERVLEEVARVLDPNGTAVFVTPNRLTFGRPDELIDPFHYIEFDPAEMATLCGNSFAKVEVSGIFGSAAYMEIFEEERAKLERLLRLDPLRLRRLPSMKMKQRLYDRLLGMFRKDGDARAARITSDDFRIETGGLDDSLDLVEPVAVPRRNECPETAGLVRHTG